MISQEDMLGIILSAQPVPGGCRRARGHHPGPPLPPRTALDLGSTGATMHLHSPLPAARSACARAGGAGPRMLAKLAGMRAWSSPAAVASGPHRPDLGEAALSGPSLHARLGGGFGVDGLEGVGCGVADIRSLAITQQGRLLQRTG